MPRQSHPSDNWTDYDTEALSVEMDFDAIDRALNCNSQQQEECLAEYQEDLNKVNQAELCERLEESRPCECIRHLAKNLLHLRLEDPILFDYFCVKTCYPELSYEDILEVFKGLDHDSIHIETRMVARHRARVAEIDSRMQKIFQNNSMDIRESLNSISKRLANIILQIEIYNKGDKRNAQKKKS